MSRITINKNVINQLSTPSLITDLIANRPATAANGVVFFATDTTTIEQYILGSWITYATGGAAGVTSITGTTNQVIASAATGNVTLSLPQSIATSSNVTFATITGTSFVKSGGTSAQFLKADGSVDSNTYLTTSSASSTYLPLIGGTLTGTLIGTGIVLTNGITASSFNTIGGTASQFLKANGTLDSNTYLTTSSAASTYLPLSGGTLTGALSGTSAAFTSSGSFGTSTLPTYYRLMVTGVNNAIGLGASGNGSYAQFSSNSVQAIFSSNWYYNSSDKFSQNGYAPRIVLNQSDGSLVFSTSNNGTADNTISYSNILTLAQSGAATFAGSLSGTSATFSQSLTSSNSVQVQNTNTAYNAQLRLTASQDWLIQSVGSSDANYANGLRIFDNTNGVSKFILTGGTNSSILNLNSTTVSSTGNALIRFQQDNSNKWQIQYDFNTATFNFYNFNTSNNALSFNSSSAATFASSVNSGSSALQINPTNGYNLLIGTTTDAGYKLQVNGTASVSQIITGQTWVNAATFNQSFTISQANGAGTTILSNNSTNYTWTLEPATGNNRLYILRTIGSNTITINTSGGDTIINNAGTSVSSLTMVAATGAIIIQSDGSSRWIQLK